MKRILYAALLVCFCSLYALASTVPVTGTIETADGNRFNGSVRMTLSYPATDTTSGKLVSPQSVSFKIQNGAIQSGAKIVPNDQMAPGNTFYVTQFYSSAGALVRQNNFHVSGSQIDLGTATPTALTSSDISFNNFTGLDVVTSKKIDNVRKCDAFPGTTARAKIIACIADLPSTGGLADSRGLEGGQAIAGQVLLSKANVTVQFGCATYTLSGVTPAQSPWVSAFFQVSANNVRIEGDPSGCTKFILAAGETANIITFGKSTSTTGFVVGGGVRYLDLDGNKSNNTSGIDDTFQNGITIVNSASAGATVDSAITVEDNRIHDFNHSGITTYGDLASGNIFARNRIYSNGKNDTFGTGDGIYLNKGASRTTVDDNYIYSNQRSGVHISSVGTSQTNNTLINNKLYLNTLNGIYAHEEDIYGSVSGIGQDGLMMISNQCFQNGAYGIRILVATDTGYIADWGVIGNVLRANGADGLIVQGFNGATNNTRQGAVIANVATGNTGNGINIASTAFDITVESNIALNNTAGQIVDTGTRTLISGNKATTANSTFNTLNALTATGLITGAGVTLTGDNALTIPRGDGAVPMVVTSSTPVANLTTVPTVYAVGGTQIKHVHHVTGQAVIGGGGTVSVTFTAPAAFVDTTYECTFGNKTATRMPSWTATSASQMDLAGTASDVITYDCIGP